MHKQHEMLEKQQKYNNLQNSFPLKKTKCTLEHYLI